MSSTAADDISIRAREPLRRIFERLQGTRRHFRKEDFPKRHSPHSRGPGGEEGSGAGSRLGPFGSSGGCDDSGDKAMVILQSLLCVLREKNLLTRADIEDLCDKVQARVSDQTANPLPCCGTTA